MACEPQKQALDLAQSLLDDFKADCHDGLRGACGKIADATRRVAAARKAYDDCVRSTPPPPPPPPTSPPPPPPTSTPPPPPPPADPCANLVLQVADLQGQISDLQDLCRSGQHLACAQIARVRMQLARAQRALRSCRYPSDHKIIRRGDTTKTSPYRILIIANPVLLQHPTSNATNYVADPILSNKAGFDAAVTYINQCLFGEQVLSAAGGTTVTQAEQLLKDPALNGKIWLESLFINNLELTAEHALVEETWASNLINPLQDNFDGVARSFGVVADVIFAVTQSATHSRASAHPVKDDASKGGVAFTMDGAALNHWFQNLVPGAIAIHSSANTLTALHEFSHAASSDSDGFVTDLYVKDPSTRNNTVNYRVGRPIPADFAKLNDTQYVSDTVRDGLGYPADWTGYHCQLNDTSRPALMDNYKNAAQLSEQIQCRHDQITRQFLLDRITAKIQRP